VVEWVAGWLGRGFGLPARQLARQPAGAGPVGAATCFPLVPDSLPDIHPPSPLPPPPPPLLLLLLPVCCTASASPCPAPLLQYPLTTLGLHAGFTWINTAQAVVLLPLFCFAYYMYRWENADLVPIRWVGGWCVWGCTAGSVLRCLYYMYCWENADLVPIRWVGVLLGGDCCWGCTAGDAGGGFGQNAGPDERQWVLPAYGESCGSVCPAAGAVNAHSHCRPIILGRHPASPSLQGMCHPLPAPHPAFDELTLCPGPRVQAHGGRRAGDALLLLTGKQSRLPDTTCSPACQWPSCTCKHVLR
jgi:hypothetical protein